MQKEQQRSLLIIPIIHTNEELLGQDDPMDQEAQAAKKAWEIITSYITTLPYNPDKALKIYPETFARPKSFDDSRLTEVQRRFIKHDYMYRTFNASEISVSPGLLLLKTLYEQGAEIEPPEDFKLVLLTHRYFSLCRRANWMGSSKIMDLLTNRRDRFIAKTINQTLDRDSVGVLFLGADHEIRPYLNPDIQAQVPQELFKDQDPLFLNGWLGLNLKRFIKI